MSDKVFRDPLYNYIGFEKEREKWLLDILDCPEMQRLRRIHQLGVSNYTYPGADHNRLSHSLGVVHLMRELLDQLQRKPHGGAVEHARQELLAAALLHDVGHGPFSHVFEGCLGIDHEAWSVRIIKDASSCVNGVLQAQSPYLPGIVSDLIEKNNYVSPGWQKALLSSQLDVDRLDYLRRDSLFTGAGYGHFDWARMISTAQLWRDGDGPLDIVWPEKSEHAIEEYIFARFYMYRNVYHHKTTRGFEKLLEAMWARARKLHREGQDVRLVESLQDFWDTPVEQQTIKQYLKLEEFTVLQQIQHWFDHPDVSLGDLARRFMNRDGFAMIRPPRLVGGALGDNYGAWEASLKELVRASGRDEEMYCLSDKIQQKHRQPYMAPEKESAEASSRNSIRVLKDGSSKPVEISEALPRLAAVTKSPEFAEARYYYVPRELRAAAYALARRMEEQCVVVVPAVVIVDAATSPGPASPLASTAPPEQTA